MARASRIWLGIFTFLPIAFIIAYMVTFGLLVKDVIFYGNEHQPMPLFTSMFWLFILMLAMGIVSFGLLVYYIILVVNSKANTDEKLLWIILFFVGSILAFPVYWYMRVWKEPVDHMGMSAT
jgi:hypothetical protein